MLNEEENVKFMAWRNKMYTVLSKVEALNSSLNSLDDMCSKTLLVDGSVKDKSKLDSYRREHNNTVSEVSSVIRSISNRIL